MKVTILDGSGATRQSFFFEKDLTAGVYDLPVDGLSAGIYFVTVQIGNWRETRKILKQ